MQFLSLAILAFSIAFSPLPAQAGPLQNPPYSKLEAKVVDIAVDYPEWVEHIEYGTTKEGRRLHMLRISDLTSEWAQRETPSQARPAVYFSASTHGNEYLRFEEDLFRFLVSNRYRLPSFRRFLKNHGVVYFIPVLNPDGYAKHVRHNSNDTDLNRDFPSAQFGHPGFREIETAALWKYLSHDLEKNHLKIAFTLDYHCCAKALVHPWSGTTKLSGPALQAHQEIGALFQNIFGDGYRVGDSSEIFKKDKDGLPVNRTGTSKDFFHETFGSLSFTFEARAKAEYENFGRHVQFLEEVFEYLNRRGSFVQQPV